MGISKKIYKDYPTLSRVVDELDERFIIGLDPKVLTDSTLIFFKIQKAFWYYKDHFEKRIKSGELPPLPLDMFGQLLIEESAILSRVYPHNQREAKYREWQEYLRRVPRLGAICLNHRRDKVLMIVPFGRGRKCLQFPRGKLHAGENHVTAASREVWEECGIRIENLIDPGLFFETTIEQTLHKLYVVSPVMEESVRTSINCQKEIEEIRWVPLTNLPGWAAGAGPEDRGFFGVAPFVAKLKAYLSRSGYLQPSPPEEGEDAEDFTADRFNRDTFGGESRSGWTVEEMLNANSRLGVESTYNETTFTESYSTRVRPEPAAAPVGVLTVPGFDIDRIMKAFKEGWNLEKI
jgi:8-oxo-dGTP pyrophosphatase MutT (NUDIX family)